MERQSASQSEHAPFILLSNEFSVFNECEGCRLQSAAGSISAVWTHFTGAGYIYPPGIHLPDERVSVEEMLLRQRRCDQQSRDPPQKKSSGCNATMSSQNTCAEYHLHIILFVSVRFFNHCEGLKSCIIYLSQLVCN